MGKVKNLWMDQQDNVTQAYLDGDLTLKDATDQLVSMGLDRTYAEEGLAVAADAVILEAF